MPSAMTDIEESNDAYDATDFSLCNAVDNVV